MNNPDNKIVRIEDKIDREANREMVISQRAGGIQFTSMLEIMEAAKLMAISGPAVPKWLQGNPGGCWAVIMQSVEWGMSPLAVARMSFEVNGVVSYMSQLVHAVIESRAPLKQRLRCEYDGEGDARVCIVTGHFDGEVDPLVYRSPPLGKINPKNSPLWKTDVDQQLWYFSSRAWCRRYAPDVLLGIYARDEIEDNPHLGAENAKDVTAASEALRQRLAAAQAGANHGTDHVAGELDKANGDHPGGAAEPAGEGSAEAGGGQPPTDASEPTPARATKASGKKKAKAPALPTNPTEYFDYAKGVLTEFVAAGKGATEINLWMNTKEQRALRGTCAVIGEELDAFKVYVKSLCDNLAAGQG